MQIIKPNKLSLLHKACQFGTDKFLSVGVLSFFSLGDVAALVPEYLGWPKILPFLQNGTILDMGLPKPCGEILVAGSAYAEKGQPVTQMDIQVTMGKMQKKLRVVGDRTWSGVRRDAPSRPRPFIAMPVDYAHAFGGEGFAQNPLGRGYTGKGSAAMGKDGILLPNIFYAGQEKDGWGKRPADVAGFAPLDIAWPQRSQFNGTYDKRWLKKIHPGFPKDTDKRLFLAAHKDQQSKSWIEPSAAYEVRGMHPDRPVLQGQLPDIVARVFVQLRRGESLLFQEAPTVIDTLWLFPEAEIGVAIHRGTCPIVDSDALDVDVLMLACESAKDQPRDAKYYREIMHLRSHPETALAHVLHEAELLPQKSASEKERVKMLYAKAKQDQKDREDAIRAHYYQILKDQHDLDVPEEQAETAQPDLELDAIPQELLESGDVDLGPLLEQVRAWGERKEAELKQKLAELEKRQQEELPEPEPQEVPCESFADMRLRVFTPVHVLATDLVADELGPIGARMAGLQEYLAEMPEAQRTADVDNLPQALRALDRTQREGRQHSPELMAPALPLPEGGARQIRAWVEELLQQGKSLAGRDLAGADLQGMDFGNQDLRDTMFEKANLTGCRFAGCRLEGAVFAGAQLHGVDFHNAQLMHANFSTAQGEGACFMAADLSHAMLSKAQFAQSDWTGAVLVQVVAMDVDWTGAVLDQVRCTDSLFQQPVLQDSRWRKATCERNVFMNANLKNSVWSESKLVRCILVDVQGEGVSLERARWEKVQCSNVGDLRGANLDGAYFSVCGFRGLDLSGASARKTVFVECDFASSKLHAAQFPQALFQRCVMMQADWQDGNCHKAFFVEGSLRKARFMQSDLREAQFSHMDLTEAVIQKCRTQGMEQNPVSTLA